MGFYGQVVYEFKKLFSSLKIIKNNSSENAIEPSTDPSFRVQALQPWDELNITPANRWIQLDGNVGTKTITIGHSTPGEKDDAKTVIGFAKIAQEELPEDVTPIELAYGDYIETTNSNYDKAGHSIEATKSYFKLPISTTETDVEQLKLDVSHMLAKFLTTSNAEEDAGKGQYIETYLTEQEYIKKDGLLTELETYLNTNEYVTHGTTGYLDTLYPEGEYATLADTIGPVTGPNGFSTALSNKLPEGTITNTVSAAIKGLITLNGDLVTEQAGLKAANSALLTIIDGLQTTIADLQSRVAELEKTKTE